MEHFDVLHAATALFAIIGYSHCLSRQLWLTISVTVALAIYGVVWQPLGALALLYGVGGLLLAGLLHWRIKANATKPATVKSAKRTTKKQIVIDGTNVLYWDGDGAQLSTLRVVVDHLKRKGYAPVAFFDGSARHHLGDKSLDESQFAKALGLPKSQVIVCPAKTEADSFILKFAREQKIPVLSNDQFRDRKPQTKGIKIVKGVMVSGKPILNGL